jgi:TNF receptor-associated factor 1
MYGDGDARGTHTSIFLVLLKGEYDPILKWPFNFPVTFCLYDQTGQGHHTIDSFYPDTSSISFQKPDSEMNIASGIPKYYPLAMIERPETCYIRDDTMFVKVTQEMQSLAAHVAKTKGNDQKVSELSLIPEYQ